MNTLPMKKFYYLFVDRETKKVTGYKVYEVRKTQEEVDKLAEEFNAKETAHHLHEKVTDEKMIQLLDLKEEKRVGTMEDLKEMFSTLSNMENDFSYLADDVRCKIDEIEKYEKKRIDKIKEEKGAL